MVRSRMADRREERQPEAGPMGHTGKAKQEKETMAGPMELTGKAKHEQAQMLWLKLPHQ